MEEISKKSTKKVLEFCQKYVIRVYITCGDFLLCGAASYLPT